MSADETRTILIVDDSFTNRMLLHKIFSQEFRVEQAQDGLEALDVLRRQPDIVAVLLDIQMPKLDGFGVLDAMRQEAALREIPVVVDTASDDVASQLKALDHGAVDVLIKPFNPSIALHRVRNIILRREADKQAARNRMLEQLLLQSEIDEKTGIYNKHAFCRKTAELLAAHPEERYVIFRWDIDRFKVFNDVFGVAAGDWFLARIGRMYRERRSGALYGHWEADHFVCCMRQSDFHADEVCAELTKLLSAQHSDFEFTVRMGVYAVDDPTLDVSLMCDRALLALRSIKNDYNTRVAWYDEAMRAALIEEQEIIGQMNAALAQGQFVVYLQPQCNYASQTLHGAEALVRWIRPDKGMLSPAKFIPIFERNGFISKLDEYVWEQVCKLQRRWIDEGLSVVPVSVNVSRRDLYNPHLCDIINGLVRRYRLSPSLLRLEVTESAYMDDPEQLIRVVESLRTSGFAVEMDDFGSGFSSLNALKSVPVDMLKLDMKFLENSLKSTRSGSILTSVIRMANWIDLPVIAEGVETKEQADYLKSVGCIYMQGFYYARPMPVSDYEALLLTAQMDGGHTPHFSEDTQGAADFLSASTQAALLFNSFVGGAAILEYDGANVEALRLNDKFFEVLGVTREFYAGRQLRLLERYDQKNHDLFLQTVRSAIQTRAETSCELCSLPLQEGGDSLWLRMRMRFLAQSGGRSLLYIAVENITQRMQLLQRNTQLSQQLSAIMDSVPGGILDFEITDRIHTVYANDIAASMFGYTHEEYLRLFADDPLQAVHPDERETVRTALEAVLRSGRRELGRSYRHLCADGDWRWVQLTGRILRREDGKIFASGILMDIDAQMRSRRIADQQAEELERQRMALQALYDTIPCGIMQFSLEADFLHSLLSFNDSAWRIFGYSDREQYVQAVHGRSKLKDIYPDDLPALSELIRKVAAGPANTLVDFDHRITRVDGGVRWVQVIMQKVSYTAGEEIVQIVFTDVTDRKQENLLRVGSALFSLYDEVYEINTEQDSCYLRYSRHGKPVGTVFAYTDFLRAKCQERVCEDDREHVRALFAGLGKDGAEASATVEYRYLTIDGRQRWASTLLLHVEGPIYLCCNWDITELKDAQRLAQENETLQLRLNARREAEERNRLFIDFAGILVYDYDPATDTMRVQSKEPDGRVTEKLTAHYLATLADNPTISVADRPRVRECFNRALRTPMRFMLEYRGNRFGSFELCRGLLASIADESGKVYRVIGQLSRAPDDYRQQLNGRLQAATGIDFSSVPYQNAVIEDVLQLLETTAEAASAINGVLAAVGRCFAVSRTYVIEEDGDGQHCTNTFEWCADGVPSEIENLQHYAYPDGQRQVYLDLFDEDGMIACPDIAALPQWIQDTLSPQGVRAIILCAIMEGGAFRGYVGFDECTGPRNWTEEQVGTLRIISHLLGVFLLDNRGHIAFDISSQALEAAEKSPALLYVIDPDSCEVLYCNRAFQASAGGSILGEVCYRAFNNRDTMCDICPLRELRRTGMSIPMLVHRGSERFIMQASSLLWRGRKAILLTGTEEACFAEAPETLRQNAYDEALRRYAYTLSPLFDQVQEFDFAADVFQVVMSRFPTAAHVGQKLPLHATYSGWLHQSIRAEDRPAMAQLMDPVYIRNSFRKGKAPSITYHITPPGVEERVCTATLLQLDNNRYLCCSKDVTEQTRTRQMQQELLVLQSQTRAQDRYRIVVEQTGAAVVEKNLETDEFSCSENYRQYEISRHTFGAALLSRGSRTLVHPDDLPLLMQMLEQYESGAEHIEGILRAKMVDGSYRWTRVAATFLRSNACKLQRIVGTLTDVDEATRAKLRLETISETMRQLVTYIPTGVAIYELGDKVLPVYISDKTCALFGFTREEYDLRIANGLPIHFMPDREHLPELDEEALQSGQPITVERLHVQRKDGSWFWLHAFCNFHRDDTGRLLCYAVLADVTQEVQRDQQLKWQNERYRILSEAPNTITFDYAPDEDTLHVTLTSASGETRQEKHASYLAGLNEYLRIAPESKDGFAAALQSACVRAANGVFDFRADYTQKGYRWYRATYVSLVDESGQVYRVVGRLDDIDDIMCQQDRLRSQAQIDGMTGVRNKDSARAAVEDVLLRRPVERFDALLFFDVDNFKKINDTIGHFDADQVLAQIGAVLRRLFRKEDICARFGGDEFLVYLPSIGDIGVAERRARQLIREINAIVLPSYGSMSCSVGLTGIHGEGATFEAVFRRADAALNEAKRAGKSRYVVRCE